MAPKPKVADLEAELKSKEAELQAAHSALVKAEASRAKLKQYLESFREQAVSTTELINKFRNLQQDYDSLQEKYQQLKQETERQPTAAVETGTLPPDGSAGASGPDLAIASLEEQLREERQRGQQLQERCARLQEEQQAAAREVEQLRREKQQQQHSQAVSGPAASSKRQQDAQKSAQDLLLQLQEEQRLSAELRTQLQSAVRQQQLLLQQQEGGSPVGGSAAVRRAGVAASSLPLGEVGTAAVTTGVAAAAAHTQATTRKTAGCPSTTATAASRRRRGRGDESRSLGSVGESAATTSESDSESGGDGNRGCDGGGSLGRASSGQHRRAREVAAAQSRWKAAEAALETTRREVEELRRREAAQKAEMDQLQAQLQALQALVAEHAAALKRQSVHLQQHDAILQRQNLQLERHGDQLQLHDIYQQRHENCLQEYNDHLKRHDLQLEQHKGELQRHSNELVVAREGHEAETAAVHRQLDGFVAQLRSINRTHSILRQAFGGSDVGGSVGEGNVDDHGFRATGAVKGASGQPNVGSLLPPPAAARRDGFGAPPAARDAMETGTAAAVCTGPFSTKELRPETQGAIEVAVDGGIAALGWAALGVPEDDEAEDEQEKAGRHRDKRQRLENSDMTVILGRGGGVGMQPNCVAANEYPLPPQELQQQQQPGQHHQVPTANVHSAAAAAALRCDVVEASGLQPFAGASTERKDRKRRAAAAPADDAGGETSKHRQGRGRPRKERIPSELLSTLLDGKATGAGNLTKVAAATARRAAAAVQANTLQPMPLASAICSAILRCCRDRVSVTAAANVDAGTVPPPRSMAMAIDGLPTNEAGLQRGGSSRDRGAAAAEGTMANGGFLSVLLPPGRSRGQAGPGAATATAAGFGRVTLLDALACLWCEPVEQQRQLIKWLLQVVGDTDRILGKEMTVLRGNGDSAAAVCAAVETDGGGGSDGAADLRKASASHPSFRAAANASPLTIVGGTGQTKIGVAAAVVEAATREQPGNGQVAPPRRKPVALLGSLLAHQLNAVACCPLDGRSLPAEAEAAAYGGGLRGKGVVNGVGTGGTAVLLQGKGTETVTGGAAAGSTSGPASLPQRCAASHALGQLFRLYGDREGYQSTALELLHVAAEARSSNALLSSGTAVAIAANCECGQQPAVPASCPSGAVANIRTSAPQAADARADCSLVPLCCLTVGWPQALSTPPLLTLPLPALVQADNQASSADATAAAAAAKTTMPLDDGGFSRQGPPLTISTGLGAAQGRRVGTSHDRVAAGGYRAWGGLHEGLDDRDNLEDMFGDVEPESPHSPPRLGSGLLEMAEALVWADPAWEAQLVSEPLAVAIATCAQLLALERLAECCIGGMTSMGDGIGEGAGRGDANSTALPPIVATATVPQLPSRCSILSGSSESLVALDCHAEAVASAVLLRALWEQHQQPSTGLGNQKSVSLLLPGVAEVLLTVGAIQTAMQSGAAVTTIEAALAKGRMGDIDASGGLQSSANTSGGSKCRGDDGVGNNGSGSVGVDEDLNTVLSAALVRARSAISELASRLMGLLLTAVMERQQLGLRRHAHVGQQRQQEQQLYRPVDRATGDDPSGGAAAAQGPSEAPGTQSHLHMPVTFMLPSDGAEAAYLLNLRQALLLTCHLLPHDQVYDRVLRQLVLWLYPGGPVAISSAAGTQQPKRRHEAMLLATGQAMAGGVLADGGEGPVAAADTAASAAGSPLMVTGMEAADVPGMAVRICSGQPLLTADGTAAKVETAAAKVAIARPLPSLAACSLDLGTVRLVLELIKDIACQALGCAAAYDGRGQLFAPASPSASPSPSTSSPDTSTGSGTNADALVLRLACSSLCESLAGLLPALQHRVLCGEDIVAAAAQGGEVGGMQEVQQGPGVAAAAGGEATDVPRVAGCGEEGEGIDAAVATLLSVVAQVAGMCVAGLPLEPPTSAAAAAAAAAHHSAGGGMRWDSDAAALGGQAGPNTGSGPTSAEGLTVRFSTSREAVGEEVKARVGRALRAVQQGLIGPVGGKTVAAAAVVGLPVQPGNAGQAAKWQGPAPRPLEGLLAAPCLVEDLPMVDM
ncbi:hypothetical protein Vretimale_10487 [Volvox reticuliferus]|uniref:Uncharacterized protein n=1 Tax=Volvox reticuliferus TaxID=1737510 RepID=A0A8J4GET6_9CHLO|nr:hypothetical protein Vretifemale_12552 [Volvox reticuliferus]GIM06217.1 hypothetical protein Vretimale_10487 [Volvox reticuliferus]